MYGDHITWEDIVARYADHPADVITVPITKKTGIWFHVFTKNGSVYISGARHHQESSKLSWPVRLQSEKFEEMLHIYLRRKNGVPVSQEATAATRQQVYWYGIFADMGI